MTTAIVLVCAMSVSLAADSSPSPQGSTSSHQTLEIADAQAQAGYAMSMPKGPVLSPADPNPTPAIDCVNHCPPGYEATWNALGPAWGFQEWAQGEYVGRARLPHVPTYRLRVDDQMEFVFRVTRNKIPGPYKINIGDELQVESAAETELQRTLVVLPDGTITLPLVGSVRAAGMSVEQLRG
ncbi:MAG: polysaccharide biosynthesis/export family protein, partial [Pirellulales bacterium]